MLMAFVLGSSVLADVGSERFSQATFSASGATSFTVNYHHVWANASAWIDIKQSKEFPECIGSQYDADFDAAKFSAVALAVVGCDGTSGQESYQDSQSLSFFDSITGQEITWYGTWRAIGREALGDIVACYASGSYGASVSFTVDGAFDITPPTCPFPVSGEGRIVTANIYCLPSGPLASYAVSHGLLNKTHCIATPITLGSGTYDLELVTLTISDLEHDSTGDFRFNQDDIDFLASSVVGMALATDPLYVDRFDYDANGVIESDDIEILQCFVDACLDARRIGDADCDNDIDCNDLLIAATQPFAGELFTGSVYKVGFDVDLDGDNDAADKAAISDLMLQLEPANFAFDGSLNYLDTSEFLALYSSQDPRADMNGDGTFNFLDTSAFLSALGNPNCLTP